MNTTYLVVFDPKVKGRCGCQQRYFTTCPGLKDWRHISLDLQGGLHSDDGAKPGGRLIRGMDEIRGNPYIAGIRQPRGCPVL